MDIFAQQLINGLVLGAMYALVALGYTMVYGVLNLINFAHGDVLMIGAMVGGILLGLIESLGAGYIGDLTAGVLGSHYQDIFAFIVLILVLTLRPSGIMGERVADRS